MFRYSLWEPVLYTNHYGGTSFLSLRPRGLSMTFITALFRVLFNTYVPPYDCAALLVVFTSPPKAALFSPHSALRYSHQSPHSIPYDVTPATTPHDTHSSSSQLQDGGPLPTRRCSLLQTLRNTIYHSIRRHQHFPSFFPKFPFSKIFWALSRGPGGYCPSFSNSPTHAAYPRIFSDVSTFIFTSFFRVLPSIYFLV